MNVSAVNNQQDSSERPWEENDEVQVPFLNSANTQVTWWLTCAIYFILHAHVLDDRDQ